MICLAVDHDNCTEDYAISVQWANRSFGSFQDTLRAEIGRDPRHVLALLVEGEPADIPPDRAAEMIGPLAAIAHKWASRPDGFKPDTYPFTGVSYDPRITELIVVLAVAHATGKPATWE